MPEPLILGEGARVMSLIDGRSKMSKSDPNAGSRIALLDPPELITKKIKRAKTDPVMGLEFGNPERPEADNLLRLYALLSGREPEAAARGVRRHGLGDLQTPAGGGRGGSPAAGPGTLWGAAQEPDFLAGVLEQGRERADSRGPADPEPGAAGAGIPALLSRGAALGEPGRRSER